MASGGGTNVRIQLKDDETVTLQFLTGIDEFTEYYQHQFQDDGWNYVPCIGKGCPLCKDEDPNVKKRNYRFACNAYTFNEKRVGVFEGPKTLATIIAHRYERKPTRFLKRTWDVSRFSTTPTSYDVDASDDPPINTSKLKPVDLKEYVKGQLVRYYGDDIPTGKGEKSALDDDDEETEEDYFDEDELEEMEWKELKKYAKSLGIKTEGKKRSELIRRIIKKQEG